MPPACGCFSGHCWTSRELLQPCSLLGPPKGILNQCDSKALQNSSVLLKGIMGAEVKIIVSSSYIMIKSHGFIAIGHCVAVSKLKEHRWSICIDTTGCIRFYFGVILLWKACKWLRDGKNERVVYIVTKACCRVAPVTSVQRSVWKQGLWCGLYLIPIKACSCVQFLLLCILRRDV